MQGPCADSHFFSDDWSVNLVADTVLLFLSGETNVG